LGTWCAGLAGADPHAVLAVLVQRPGLVVQDGVDIRVVRHQALEMATRLAHEDAVVEAHPQVAGAVFADHERARHHGGVIPGLAGDVRDGAGGKLQLVEAALGGHPEHIRVARAGDAEHLAVRRAALAHRIEMEAHGLRVEAQQAAGIGAHEQAAVVERHQRTHVGVGQHGTAVRVRLLAEHLHAVAVVAGQAAERADPDQPGLVLHDGGGGGMRQAVGHAHRIEPRRFIGGPWVDADLRRHVGHLRQRATGTEQAQGKQDYRGAKPPLAAWPVRTLSLHKPTRGRGSG
jgi:hypothetical protein